ncbi:hypothetical protein [Legionella gresilensis]|uniref:hypothetical protein n=1 Tax=Legionella gresilensis TaxID=91823 RepID=UPI0010414D7C|nr:hypothetical protein [Legionella gresilensis]
MFKSYEFILNQLQKLIFLQKTILEALKKDSKEYEVFMKSLNKIMLPYRLESPDKEIEEEEVLTKLKDSQIILDIENGLKAMAKKRDPDYNVLLPVSSETISKSLEAIIKYYESTIKEIAEIPEIEEVKVIPKKRNKSQSLRSRPSTASKIKPSVYYEPSSVSIDKVPNENSDSHLEPAVGEPNQDNASKEEQLQKLREEFNSLSTIHSNSNLAIAELIQSDEFKLDWPLREMVGKFNTKQKEIEEAIKKNKLYLSKIEQKDDSIDDTIRNLTIMFSQLRELNKDQIIFLVDINQRKEIVSSEIREIKNLASRRMQAKEDIQKQLEGFSQFLKHVRENPKFSLVLEGSTEIFIDNFTKKLTSDLGFATTDINAKRKLFFKANSKKQSEDLISPKSNRKRSWTFPNWQNIDRKQYIEHIIKLHTLREELTSFKRNLQMELAFAPEISPSKLMHSNLPQPQSDPKISISTDDDLNLQQTEAAQNRLTNSDEVEVRSAVEPTKVIIDDSNLQQESELTNSYSTQVQSDYEQKKLIESLNSPEIKAEQDRLIETLYEEISKSLRDIKENINASLELYEIRSEHLVVKENKSFLEYIKNLESSLNIGHFNYSQTLEDKKTSSAGQLAIIKQEENFLAELRSLEKEIPFLIEKASSLKLYASLTATLDTELGKLAPIMKLFLTDEKITKEYQISLTNAKDELISLKEQYTQGTVSQKDFFDELKKREIEIEELCKDTEPTLTEITKSFFEQKKGLIKDYCQHLEGLKIKLNQLIPSDKVTEIQQDIDNQLTKYKEISEEQVDLNKLSEEFGKYINIVTKQIANLEYHQFVEEYSKQLEGLEAKLSKLEPASDKLQEDLKALKSQLAKPKKPKVKLQKLDKEFSQKFKEELEVLKREMSEQLKKQIETQTTEVRKKITTIQSDLNKQLELFKKDNLTHPTVKGAQQLCELLATILDSFENTVREFNKTTEKDITKTLDAQIRFLSTLRFYGDKNEFRVANTYMETLNSLKNEEDNQKTMLIEQYNIIVQNINNILSSTYWPSTNRPEGVEKLEELSKNQGEQLSLDTIKKNIKNLEEQLSLLSEALLKSLKPKHHQLENNWLHETYFFIKKALEQDNDRDKKEKESIYKALDDIYKKYTEASKLWLENLIHFPNIEQIKLREGVTDLDIDNFYKAINAHEEAIDKAELLFKQTSKEYKATLEVLRIIEDEFKEIVRKTNMVPVDENFSISEFMTGFKADKMDSRLPKLSSMYQRLTEINENYLTRKLKPSNAVNNHNFELRLTIAAKEYKKALVKEVSKLQQNGMENISDEARPGWAKVLRSIAQVFARVFGSKKSEEADDKKLSKNRYSTYTTYSPTLGASGTEKALGTATDKLMAIIIPTKS